jgi:hypothetical protein
MKGDNNTNIFFKINAMTTLGSHQEHELDAEQ